MKLYEEEKGAPAAPAAPAAQAAENTQRSPSLYLYCTYRYNKCAFTDDTRRTHVEIQFSEILSLTVEFN
jgi:hypothetical protein